MNARAVLVTTLSAALALSGCSAGHRTWGKGTWIPAAVCAVVGGVGGAAIESEGFSDKSIRSGESCGTINGSTVCKHDSPDYAAATAIGAVSGAVVCGLLGHFLLDPVVVTPTPPPPPPPPPMPTPPPPTSQHIVLRGVHFDFNKSDIRVDSRPVLDAGADVLNENHNVRISVEGHTDGIGGDEYNQKLSVRRAEAVFRYLVNHGVAPERMEVVGHGKARPVASNDTEDGRAQNRRVELHVANEPAPATE